MTIELHIERLVLTGLTMHAAQGEAVQAALERELGRLLGAGPLQRQFAAGDGVVPSIRGGDIRTTPADAPAHLGARIATSLASAMGSGR